MCFDENLLGSEYFNHAITQGNESKSLLSLSVPETSVELPYTAPQTPPFTNADILQQSYSQPHATPVSYTLIQQTPISNRKRSYDQLTEDSDLGERFSFDQVSRQNPYLVHRLVMKTIHMEFAIEDQYNNGTSHQNHSIRIRKRRKPQECEWKPESVYKSYVECKPHFFEKSDYQDFIPRSSCFGKINMRIPKAWTRKPNKPKIVTARNASHYDAMVEAYDYQVPQKRASAASKTDLTLFDDILAFNFLFE